MTVQYNHLNLPKLFTFAGGGQAGTVEVRYDAAGKKLQKKVKTGTTLNYTQDYLGGIEYRDTVREAIYHAEGRVFYTGPATTRYEYAIRDHLGNTRLTFTDKNGNGVVDMTDSPATNEVLQENHYYPFGLGMAGPWMDDAALDNKYQYNGKEWNDDFGLNLNDYGARWYDAALGRWWSVDPLAADYAQWSTYNYVLGNPVRLVDPDGREAIQPEDDYYDSNGNYLFRDSKTTDYIRIVSDRALDNVYPKILSYKPGKERSEFLEKYLENNSQLISDTELSVQAVSKITTNILDKMTDVDASKLLHGKTSVIDFIRGDKFNDPENESSFANTLVTANGIKITILIRSGKVPSDLSTVSNIKNALGAHEFQGHGILGYGNKTGNHSKAYEHQFNHPSWNATTPNFKEYMKENHNYYKTIEKK